MDIVRNGFAKTRRRVLIGVSAAVLITALSWAAAQIKPSVPAISRGDVAIDTVRIGSFPERVRGSGVFLAGLSSKVRVHLSVDVARGIEAGQKATLQFAGGTVAGIVEAYAAGTEQGTCDVDVMLSAPFPSAVKSSDSAQATIEIGQVDNAPLIGRPGFGREHSRIAIFKLATDGATARRTPVKLGRGGTNSVEVLEGLKVGDQVILSDLSQLPDQISIKKAN